MDIISEYQKMYDKAIELTEKDIKRLLPEEKHKELIYQNIFEKHLELMSEMFNISLRIASRTRKK